MLASLQFLVEENRIWLYGYVIMPNHIHLLWKIEDGFERADVQGALLSFTAHAFKKNLEVNDIIKLANYKVNLIDRTFQFWQRECVVKECWVEHFFEQKLDYTHNNPVQPHWNLSDISENYYWSSSSFYEIGVSPFKFLKHYKD